MVTKKNQTKTMTKHISCDCKCKFINTTRNSNQKRNNETCQCECKNYNCRKGDSCNPSKYLKVIDDTSVIQCDEITTVMDIVLTKMTNTIAPNVTSTASINCHSKKAKDC